MNIVEKKITEIIPYENNPRNNDEAVKYVAESIRQFGFKVPIVIDKDNVIVTGHTRMKAAKQLGYKTVPCIVADDLSEDQIKAFRLADNKVAEYAEWDFDLLIDELVDLADFDMEVFGFGFEISEELEKLFEEEEKVNERERTDNAYNLNEYDEDCVEGYYQMPTIEGVDYVPTDLIGFNYALSSDSYESGIHFYVDDYQFERVWNQPWKYIDKLAEFDCMLTPDFSLYQEMPIAMKIWNTYRSRLIGQLAQRRGITVIPTVSWCERATFDFCFDGLPRNATLSISTIGVKESDENMELWKQGVDEMIRRLEPKRLLVYGGAVYYDYGDIEVTLWCELVRNLIEQYDEKKLFNHLKVWVIKSNQWLTNKPEVEIEALELHACRIFDNPLWVGYVEFNEKYRPEVLHGVELVWVVNQVETTPQRITRVKMERDNATDFTKNTCGVWIECATPLQKEKE